MPIYGSVSTVDIATAVKEMVAYNDEAARITLSEREIKFSDLPESDDPTRVKHIGEYSIGITMKGSDDTVSRRVQVIAWTPEQHDKEKEKEKEGIIPGEPMFPRDTASASLN